MTVGEQDQRRVAVAVAPQAAGRLDEGLDFGGREVLPRPTRAVRLAPRRGDFPVFDAWRQALGDT